ncbi:Protein-L-isoaspartate O-methyltransferase [Tepidimonas fonticaldi]|uniref:Protein-L-isoaspartate O-methyltransferase n=1 Tax=Tepidimonas fonticaldi TaxID=1101373 RepID=A0A1A6DX22_9BURK|nr:protein-L-isoaspartate(D-aspartate) O-methyltransferase [Tepidimonas fonticaldi]OBS31340.1 protein-L-isoaspartate O-methyltransferase [Tepidimonas fonticaldi]TSE37700.1 Protein-L-isoaspartate O-methyltransferase [Tepidimonas fonticaldi]
MVKPRPDAPPAAAPAAAGARPRFPATLDRVAPAAAGGRPGGPGSAATRPSGRATAPAPPPVAGVGLDSAAVRRAMVGRLADLGLTHPAVLQAFERVERHRFVDSALAAQAYEDTSLPIGWGQTISKPSVVGRMLELLCAGRSLPLGRVLEIGTGCGYQAALLSHLCHEVYSMERLRALHEKARENLRPLRIPNIHLIFGDGMPGFAQGGPYAGIIAAAGGEDIPTAWLEQLAVGARLVAPAELQPGRQSLVVVERTPKGFERQVLEGVWFVPLKSGVA